MLIRLKSNIGRSETSITPPLLAGQEREVDLLTGSRLVARGFAIDITPQPPPPPPPVIQAIPDSPPIAEAKSPEIMPAHTDGERNVRTYIERQRRKPK